MRGRDHVLSGGARSGIAEDIDSCRLDAVPLMAERRFPLTSSLERIPSGGAMHVAAVAWALSIIVACDRFWRNADAGSIALSIQQPTAYRLVSILLADVHDAIQRAGLMDVKESL